MSQTVGMADSLPNTLLLIPTSLEREHFFDHSVSESLDARVELCGFGPVAAGIRAAFLIDRFQPQRVILAGIAGTYDPSVLAVGQAAAFNTVAMYGVGAGTGPAFHWASELGFAQWPGEDGQGEEIQEHLDIVGPRNEQLNFLLTCCAASASAGDVEDRLQCSPGSIAEDMEGFAVAMACRMAKVPVAIVRGISNIAGDRNTEKWKIDEALRATWTLLTTIAETFDDLEPPA